ncbi:MAG: hypothetical protein R3F43_09650 [bacterium]
MVIALKAGAVQGVTSPAASRPSPTPPLRRPDPPVAGQPDHPLRFSLDQVLAGAEGRAVFRRAR